MDFGLGILTFGTLGFVCAFAYLNARATEKRRQDRRDARRGASGTATPSGAGL